MAIPHTLLVAQVHSSGTRLLPSPPLSITGVNSAVAQGFPLIDLTDPKQLHG